MERLSFVLPDFTRLIWVSDASRETWASRIHRITQAWFEIEWRAVAAGLRSCAVTVVGSERLTDSVATWLDHGLSAWPVEIQGASNAYASTAVEPTLGKPFVYRVVVGRLENLQAFRTAWRAGDEGTIGALLGYPPCCTAFFRRVWVDTAMVDTTWPMAIATASETNGARLVTVAGPPEANILWRWMGVRAVPHLPCRFDCGPTVALARSLLRVGRDAGYGEEMDWLVEILRWPLEWSALHGIAEIKTPVLKVSTRTDATPVKYVVRREGDSYPADGARGLTFPYRAPRRRLVTEGRAFRRGLEQAVPAASTPGWYATDNGFDSVAGMEQAHAPIVALARRVLSSRRGAVLDLGCGNGALLARLQAECTGVIPYGIDVDPDRTAHARTLLASHAENFWVGDLFESDLPWREGRRYTLALLMPGRLLEAAPAQAETLRARLHRWCDDVLVYAYGDWLARHGGLDGLSAAAGLRVESRQGSVGLAAIPEGAPEDAR